MRACRGASGALLWKRCVTITTTRGKGGSGWRSGSSTSSAVAHLVDGTAGQLVGAGLGPFDRRAQGEQFSPRCFRGGRFSVRFVGEGWHSLSLATCIARARVHEFGVCPVRGPELSPPARASATRRAGGWQALLSYQGCDPPDELGGDLCGDGHRTQVVRHMHAVVSPRQIPEGYTI
jgi:hypothetical protein